MDRKIDAVIERAEKQRRGPGVVDHHRGAMAMRHSRDGGNVLNLERQRAGAFAEHRLGVRLHQFRDAGADQGIVIGGLDPHALQQPVAEAARRAIAIVGHQQMIAMAAHRQDGERNRIEPGGAEHGARATFEKRECVFQTLGGWCATAAIGVTGIARFERREIRIENGRCAVDRRVDRTEMIVTHAARMGQNGIAIILLRRHRRLLQASCEIGEWRVFGVPSRQ